MTTDPIEPSAGSFGAKCTSNLVGFIDLQWSLQMGLLTPNPDMYLYRIPCMEPLHGTASVYWPLSIKFGTGQPLRDVPVASEIPH